MAAYMIFIRQNVKDQAELDTYIAMSKNVQGQHEMQNLAVFGPHRVLEGEPIEGAAVVRFEDQAAAEAFYFSEEYQEATRHRLAGADYLTFIIEGK